MNIEDLANEAVKRAVEMGRGSQEDLDLIARAGRGEIEEIYPANLSLDGSECAIVALAISELGKDAPLSIQHICAAILFKMTWATHGIELAKATWHLSSPPGTPYPVDIDSEPNA